VLEAAIIAAGLVLMQAQDYRAAVQDYETALSRLTSHAPGASLEDVYARAVVSRSHAIHARQSAIRFKCVSG
jgi:hypothetical protein